MEPIRDSVLVTLEEDSQVPVARRAARDLAQRVGLSADAIARAELATVELAGNILRHAARGALTLAPSLSGNGVLIVAADSGPGIPAVHQALADGFSTSTTPGLGLGAVRRLAASFDLYTQVSKGTVLTALIADEPASLNSTAVLSTAMTGETLNGDSWLIVDLPQANRTVYLLVDGLGHGHYACEASGTARNIAEKSFADEPDLALDLLLERMHGPMRATRGAAIALISVEPAQITCCGVGNISCTLHAPEGTDRTLISNNGTLGHQMRRIQGRVQQFRYPYAPNTLLIMHSDGLSTRWRLGLYPDLAQHTPATIAGVLYRDAARHRDDATILVARLGLDSAGVFHA
jgi:anti-sigma regulatory factor (Ser/Thr protein kinase)